MKTKQTDKKVYRMYKSRRYDTKTITNLEHEGDFIYKILKEIKK